MHGFSGTKLADVFIDEVVSFYHPREKFAPAFAASFLVPASKVRDIIEKEIGGRGLAFDQRDPDTREREVFRAATEVQRAGEAQRAGGGQRASVGRAVYSDRYKLLWHTAKTRAFRRRGQAALFNKSGKEE